MGFSTRALSLLFFFSVNLLSSNLLAQPTGAKSSGSNEASWRLKSAVSLPSGLYTQFSSESGESSLKLAPISLPKNQSIIGGVLRGDTAILFTSGPEKSSSVLEIRYGSEGVASSVRPRAPSAADISLRSLVVTAPAPPTLIGPPRCSIAPPRTITGKESRLNSAALPTRAMTDGSDAGCSPNGCAPKVVQDALLDQLGDDIARAAQEVADLENLHKQAVVELAKFCDRDNPLKPPMDCIDMRNKVLKLADDLINKHSALKGLIFKFNARAALVGALPKCCAALKGISIVTGSAIRRCLAIVASAGVGAILEVLCSGGTCYGDFPEDWDNHPCQAQLDAMMDFRSQYDDAGCAAMELQYGAWPNFHCRFSCSPAAQACATLAAKYRDAADKYEECLKDPDGPNCVNYVDGVPDSGAVCSEPGSGPEK